MPAGVSWGQKPCSDRKQNAGTNQSCGYGSTVRLFSTCVSGWTMKPLMAYQWGPSASGALPRHLSFEVVLACLERREF